MVSAITEDGLDRVRQTEKGLQGSAFQFFPISASRTRIDSVEDFYLVLAIGRRDGDGESDGSAASPAAASAVGGQEGRKGRMEGEQLVRRGKAAACVCFIRPRPASHCALGSPSRFVS